MAPPANGVLTGDGVSQVYTPTAGFTGIDSFIYQVSDGVSASDAVVVEITVAALPAPIVNETRALDDIEGLISEVPHTIELGGDNPVFVQPDGPESEAEMSVASSAPEVADVVLTDTTLEVFLVGEGEATVTVSTVTADATASVSVSFGVVATAPIVQNDPPTVGRIASIVLTEGEQVTVSPSISDPEDDPVSLEVTLIEQVSGRDGDSEPSVTYDAAAQEITVGVEQIGGLQAKFRVVMEATDGQNDPVEVEFYVTAETNNEPPALSVPSDIVAETGVDVTIEVVANDPNEGDAVTISGALQSQDTDIRSAVRSALRDFNTSETVADAGSYVKTLTFAVPDELEGKFFTLQWTADDSLGSANATTVITVGEDVNLPPVIEPIAETVVDEGGSAEVAVSVSDPEGGVVTLTVTGLLDGATFDDATSTMTWPDISFDRSGRWAFTVDAVDDAEQTASSSIVVTVQDVNQEPALVFTNADAPDSTSVLGSIDI